MSHKAFWNNCVRLIFLHCSCDKTNKTVYFKYSEPIRAKIYLQYIDFHDTDFYDNSFSASVSYHKSESVYKIKIIIGATARDLSH